MSEKPDTVPGLGFKDKDKALETIKNLEGRDPDYQKLAIKGLIGRAKRTLTLTKDKEKLQNINDALAVFDGWLNNFEKKNLSKENKAYLPLASIKTLLPLKEQYKLNNKKAEQFLAAYKKVNGEYKNLRTVSSGEGEPTWDIVRNSELKPLIKKIEDDDDVRLWKDDLPTKEHMELILWAYSPEAAKIKKNLATYEEKLGSAGGSSSDDEMKSDSDEKSEPKGKKDKSSKRKSESQSSSSENEESPKKKGKSS